MGDEIRLSYIASLILEGVSKGYAYGFELMQATGLPSGTIYPALRRLEEAGFIKSRWEQESAAHEQQRPARRNYSITRAGAKVLETVSKRYRLLGQLEPAH